MSTPISCLLGWHGWITKEYSLKGIVHGYRMGFRCQREETMRYEYRLQKPIWVQGKYVSEEIGEPQRIFIFAGSGKGFHNAVNIIREDPDVHGELIFIWVKDSTLWDEIE